MKAELTERQRLRGIGRALLEDQERRGVSFSAECERLGVDGETLAAAYEGYAPALAIAAQALADTMNREVQR